MATATVTQHPGFNGDSGLLARRLSGPALLAGLLGGLAMIVVMILVMGAAGMGYATPLNLGMAAFVFTPAGNGNPRAAGGAVLYAGMCAQPSLPVMDSATAVSYPTWIAPCLRVRGAPGNHSG